MTTVFITEEGDDLPIEGMMKLVESGGSFDWLKDEPDLYADVELEPYDDAGSELPGGPAPAGILFS